MPKPPPENLMDWPKRELANMENTWMGWDERERTYLDFLAGHGYEVGDVEKARLPKPRKGKAGEDDG